MSHFFKRNYVGALPGTPATRREEVLGANGSEPSDSGADHIVSWKHAQSPKRTFSASTENCVCFDPSASSVGHVIPDMNFRVWKALCSVSVASDIENVPEQETGAPSMVRRHWTCS